MPRTPPTVIVTPRLDLCLDFVNTLGWRVSTKTESLNDFSDFLEWCGANRAWPTGAFDELRKWAAKYPAEAAAVYQDAIRIREALYRILFAITSNETPAPADLRVLNAALEDAPARASLIASGDSFGWRVAIPPPSAASMLAPVVWSAGDLLVAANRGRVRHCANERCLWLFIDDSKNGSRRWCSMQSCGNRAKAQRHYQRRKSA
jgi:predicted RNA-binding Zn ribbon-like protein